jgi:beta-lactamase superfamily II metal-dependent hydrolase
MKRVVLMSALAVALGAGPYAQAPQPAAAAKTGKTLDIYVADTEGGKAALFVSPSGQTLLIDAGNPGERDLTRILAMLGEAGVTKLDYLISTHYHVDHIGGMQELARKIPIATFIDHGPNTESREQVQNFSTSYEQIRGTAKHLVVKPGDRVPITGLDWRIVTAAGAVLKTPLPGGGKPNPACASFEKRPDPPTPDDNAASVGSVVTYGQFRLIDLGDLLWNVEGQLMCPNNPIGTVDLYMVTHHGLAQSNSDVVIQGVRPRVALMQNGTRKGGAVPVFESLRKSPGFEDVWQLHWAYAGGIEYNAPGVFIANVDDPATIAGVLTAPPGGGRGGPGGPGGRGGAPGAGVPPAAAGGPPAAAPGAGAPATPPAAAPGTSPAAGAAPGPGAPPPAGAAPGGPGGPGAGAGRGGGFGGGAAAHTPAYYIKVSAQADGSFTVTNTRNGFSKTYPKRAN